MAKHALDGIDGFAGRKEHFLFYPKNIVVDGSNPRKHFDPVKLAELKTYVIGGGQVPPLMLRFGDNGQMILVTGERRLRAVTMAIEEMLVPSDYSVPVVLADTRKKPISKADITCLQLAENNGESLLPTEEANGYQSLKDEGLSAQEIANRVGKSHTHVYNRLALLKAEPEVQKAVESNEIPIKKAVEIAKEPAPLQGKALLAAKTEKAEIGELRGRPAKDPAAPAKPKAPEPPVDDAPTVGDPPEPKRGRRMSDKEIEKEIRNLDAKDPGQDNEFVQGMLLAYRNVLGIKED